MINISIDLNKIDKTRIKVHANGAKYYNITVDEKQTADQYGNTHSVYDTPTKEERTAKKTKSYLGSGKEFKFNNQNNTAPAQQAAPPVQQQSPTTIDDLPF